MPRRRKILGKGATLNALIKFIHPSEHIRNKFPNPVNQQRLDGLTAVRRELKVVSRKKQMCIVCTHPGFKTEGGELVELHFVERWATIVNEGPEDLFFDTLDGDPDVISDVDSTENEGNGQGSNEVEVPWQLQNPSNVDLDSIRMAIDGIVDIDDDNCPVEDNIPNSNDDEDECIYSDNWGHNGVCFREANGVNSNRQPKLKFHSRDLNLSRLQLFEILFPVKWIKELIIPHINDKHDINLSYGEWLQFVGITLKISTQTGFQRRDFWKTNTCETNERLTPFKFNHIMSRDRFETILTYMEYSTGSPPIYIDKFWEVREMIAEWNSTMEKEFMPGDTCCLDESMSKWVNQFTCPGFILCPRKPWPLGNEYHSICCNKSKVMFRIELVEGKDAPPERGEPEHNELGKTVGLLLRLTKPLKHSGTKVICDSGFCVLKAVAKCKEVGVYVSALIKKRRYWPKHVKGDEIKAHFEDKEVGYVDAIQCKMDGQDLYIMGCKVPDYVLMFMTAYGTMN